MYTYSLGDIASSAVEGLDGRSRFDICNIQDVIITNMGSKISGRREKRNMLVEDGRICRISEK